MFDRVALLFLNLILQTLCRSTPLESVMLNMLFIVCFVFIPRLFLQSMCGGDGRSLCVIDCIINNSGSTIREIIIKNYRQKERVDEIINTATWSLTRMIENSV